MTTTLSNPFASARLTYRAIEPEAQLDKDLFLAIQHDIPGYQNSTFPIHIPQAKRNAEKSMKSSIESDLLAVVICLTDSPLPPNPSSSEGSADQSSLIPTASPPVTSLTPIGQIHLSGTSKQQHAPHRTTEIGIDILPHYQGKGYGSEAIEWALKFAFESAGLHRVVIRAFEYNTGARRLYEKLGFVLEGRGRQAVWYRGRWWDDFSFAMLETEWWEKQSKQEAR